jgi:hypothetical protein
MWYSSSLPVAMVSHAAVPTDKSGGFGMVPLVLYSCMKHNACRAQAVLRSQLPNRRFRLKRGLYIAAYLTTS